MGAYINNKLRIWRFDVARRLCLELYAYASSDVNLTSLYPHRITVPQGPGLHLMNEDNHGDVETTISESMLDTAVMVDPLLSFW